MNELFILILIIVISFIFINKKIKRDEQIDVVLGPDNKKYVVRKFPNSDEAARKLARINNNIDKIIKKLKDDNKNDYGEKLERKYNDEKLGETIPGTSEYKSYSVNKGEEIKICLRNEDTNDFIDDNIIMFVVIHELAHVITDTTGHTDEFWDKMKYLLEISEDINIYKPVNYEETPEIYCGMEINSTPYNFN